MQRDKQQNVVQSPRAWPSMTKQHENDFAASLENAANDMERLLEQLLSAQPRRW